MKIDKPKTYRQILRDGLAGRRKLEIGDIKQTGYISGECDWCGKECVTESGHLCAEIIRIGVYCGPTSFDVYVCHKCAKQILSSKKAKSHPFFAALMCYP